jgi:Tol biopolymer transport system component
VSVSSQGAQADDHCDDPAISCDGRFVVFASAATTLVPNTNPMGGIFLHDRLTGMTEFVSLTSLSTQPSGGAQWPAISADGRFVAFSSSAGNLVPGDTNQWPDVFVRDRLLATTIRVSISSGGGQANSASGEPSISPDGRFIAFESAASNLVTPDTNGTWDVFLHDQVTVTTTRASTSSTGVGGNWESHRASISSDGRHVVFDSISTNLVPGDTNGSADVFVRSCTPSAPRSYCLPKVNSLGCTSVLTSSGTPSASAGSGFLIRGTNVRNKKAGVLLYSTASAAMLPFQGGYLCLLPPVKRSFGLSSGGSASGHDCTGVFSADFNAWIATGKDPALLQGQDVWAQMWGRDPGFPPPDNTSLTQGLTFVIAP